MVGKLEHSVGPRCQTAEVEKQNQRNKLPQIERNGGGGLHGCMAAWDGAGPPISPRRYVEPRRRPVDARLFAAASLLAATDLRLPRFPAFYPPLHPTDFLDRRTPAETNGTRHTSTDKDKISPSQHNIWTRRLELEAHSGCTGHCDTDRAKMGGSWGFCLEPRSGRDRPTRASDWRWEAKADSPSLPPHTAV